MARLCFLSSGVSFRDSGRKKASSHHGVPPPPGAQGQAAPARTGRRRSRASPGERRNFGARWLEQRPALLGRSAKRGLPAGKKEKEEQPAAAAATAADPRRRPAGSLRGSPRDSFSRGSAEGSPGGFFVAFTLHRSSLGAAILDFNPPFFSSPHWELFFVTTAACLSPLPPP